MELYSEPAHFILELVQNADDNSYDKSVIPKLRITFGDDNIRFDTNEFGFSRGDVEAICNIALSTKKGDKQVPNKRQIGEKGIGFKAVFAVAHQVLVHSGHYSFMFDRRARLGGVVPQWAAFPDPMQGWTSILLKLKPSINTLQLVEEARKRDAGILMFLRKLREVEVQLRSGSGRWSSSNSIWRRVDEASSFSRGLTLRTLTSSASWSYIVSRHMVEEMPEEPRRMGCADSELVFAFPDIARQPAGIERREAFPETHQVYSFLPVCDYGFKASSNPGFAAGHENTG